MQTVCSCFMDLRCLCWCFWTSSRSGGSSSAQAWVSRAIMYCVPEQFVDNSYHKQCYLERVRRFRDPVDPIAELGAKMRRTATARNQHKVHSSTQCGARNATPNNTMKNPHRRRSNTTTSQATAQWRMGVSNADKKNVTT